MISVAQLIGYLAGKLDAIMDYVEREDPEKTEMIKSACEDAIKRYCEYCDERNWGYVIRHSSRKGEKP